MSQDRTIITVPTQYKYTVNTHKIFKLKIYEVSVITNRYRCAVETSDEKSSNKYISIFLLEIINAWFKFLQRMPRR